MPFKQFGPEHYLPYIVQSICSTSEVLI